MEPVPLVASHDGLRVAGLDWGGDGPPLVLLHPTGFCAGLFHPLALALRDRYRCVAVDYRGCGASDPPASRLDCSYGRAASDVAAVLDALELGEVLVLGESMGGAVGVLLDVLRPGIARRILLCEAIASPPLPGRPGAGSESPLAETARRRRAVWPDRGAVAESYASRAPLRVLAPEALEAYVRWGFRDRLDGQVELACPPEVEAWYFESAGDPDGAGRAFEHLSELGPRATVVGAESSNLPADMFAAQAEAVGSPLVTVTGTHFFLQEDTARAAELVQAQLVW